MQNEIDNDIIIKEGHIELQNGSGVLRTFRRRYMIVKKSGIVSLYSKQPSKDNTRNKKPNESFQLQGGEEIQDARMYQNRFRIKIVITSHKKQSKWTFGFESETTQKSWLNAFNAILKHLKALTRLQEVLTYGNEVTMDGQLKIGSALAACGHLLKARKIFTKLIAEYGQDSAAVHQEYETFLSSHCTDIHKAEMHFVHRKTYFCLPKEFRTTAIGARFLKISERIQFLATMKHRLQSEEHKSEHSKSYEMEYRNIENVWPFYLYSVQTKHLKAARKFALQFLNTTNRNVASYQYEYSYKDIEQQCWYIIQQCIDGKRGAVKLQARLELVADAEAQIKLKSKKYATTFSEDAIEVFPFNECLKQNEFQFNRVVSSGNVSIFGSAELDAFIDELDDLGIEYESDSENTKSKKIDITENTNSVPDFEEDEDSDEDNIAAVHAEMAKSAVIERKEKQQPQDSWLLSGDNNELGMDVGDVLDLKMDKDVDAVNATRNTRSLTAVDNERVYDIFMRIYNVLADTKHHIYPWTALMLIWSVRRDKMNHIVGNQLNKAQMQVILEFVYIFTRGCMQKFVSLSNEYSLLLCTLYNMANERDFEDVKYKMLLSGVRAIGDQKIALDDKNAVMNFIVLNKWLNKWVDNPVIKSYFSKGFKYERQRIDDSLNEYYNNVLYKDKYFNDLINIRTRNNVLTEINSQTADKVQGKPTWGPRDNNKYDVKGFGFVCQHRHISHIPKPTKKSGDFDECYLLFCLCLAKKLNPFFQNQIKVAVKPLNCNVEHFDAPIKRERRCYEVMTHELNKKSSPKAARILDFCKCTLSFENITDLMNGFKAIEKKFRICKIVNNFNKDYKNIHNYRYMNVYILCKHPSNKFVKLICEVRLSLHSIQLLQDERLSVKQCFGHVLNAQEMKIIVKQVVRRKK